MTTGSVWYGQNKLRVANQALTCGGPEILTFPRHQTMLGPTTAPKRLQGGTNSTTQSSVLYNLIHAKSRWRSQDGVQSLQKRTHQNPHGSHGDNSEYRHCHHDKQKIGNKYLTNNPHPSGQQRLSRHCTRGGSTQLHQGVVHSHL